MTIRYIPSKVFRSAVMQAPVSIMLLEGRGLVIKMLNERVMNFTGKAYEEMIGQPFFDAFPEMKAQGYDQFTEEVFRTGETVAATEVPLKFLNTAIQGEYYINILLKPQKNKQGNVNGILATANDVSELVRSRNRVAESDNKYRTIFDSMNQGLAIIEIVFDENNKPVDYIFLEVNAAFETEAGLKDVIGRRASEILGKHACFWTEKFAEVLKTGERVIITDNSTVTGKWFETNIFRLGNEENRKVAFLFTDVDERVNEEIRKQKFADELKLQVEERTKELDRSNRELLHFARIASHDLREPVRKIATFTNMMMTDPEHKLEPKTRSFLERVVVATTRLRFIIDGIRKYISLERPLQEFTKVDLNMVVNEVINSVEAMNSEKNFRVVVKPLPEVEGSYELLQQLFANLLQNSFKFNDPQKQLAIYIGSQNLVINGKEHVQIEVIDTGIGFAPEYNERIFESFMRLHPNDAYEGAGLGLALCRRIVEKHNGAITAHGSEGKGATFKILLPLKRSI